MGVSLGFLQGPFLGFRFSGIGFRLSVFVPCLPTVFLAFGLRLSVFGFRLPNGSARSCKVIDLRHSVFAFGFRALNPTLPGTLRIMSHCYAKGPCKRFIQNDLSSQEPSLR